MNAIKGILLFIARFFLSIIFVLSSFRKIFNWSDVENNLVNVFMEWHSFLYSDYLKDFFSYVLPWTPLILVTATVLELFGGLLVLFGIKSRFGAVLLIVFLIPTTFLMHNFWFFEGGRRDIEIAMFMKNLAIIGGLLMISVYGTKKQTSIKGRL